MPKSNDSIIVLMLVFFLLVLFCIQTNTPLQNKGVVVFDNSILDYGINNNPVLNQPTQPTQPIVKMENRDVTIQAQKVNEDVVQKVGKGDDVNFAEQLFLPQRKDDGIAIKPPENDIRDRNLDSWRNDSNEKKPQNIMNDLREYQQGYNEREQNPYKNMSMDEHRKKIDDEWNQRVQQTLNVNS